METTIDHTKRKPRRANGTFASQNVYNDASDYYAPKRKPRKPRYYVAEIRAEIAVSFLTVMGGILFGFALSKFMSH